MTTTNPASAGRFRASAVSDAAFLCGYPVPDALTATARAVEGPTAEAKTVRIKRRVDNRQVSVIALAPSQGAGCVLTLTDMQARGRKPLTFTARDMTATELRAFFLIAADALNTTNKIIANW